MSDAATQHRERAARFAAVIDGVTDWAAPTPVKEWTARDVVAHLTSWFPEFLAAGARSLDGQTVCATEVRGVATGWLAGAITGRGGIYTVLSPEQHDRSMTYVLALAHQSLLGFVTAVADSGLDLTAELWATRTPLFEALLGLAVSVLEENQEVTLAHVQAALDGDRARAELAAAAEAVGAAAATPESLPARVAATRDRFTGALFEPS